MPGADATVGAVAAAETLPVAPQPASSPAGLGSVAPAGAVAASFNEALTTLAAVAAAPPGGLVGKTGLLAVAPGAVGVGTGTATMQAPAGEHCQLGGFVTGHGGFDCASLAPGGHPAAYHGFGVTPAASAAAAASATAEVGEREWLVEPPGVPQLGGVAQPPTSEQAEAALMAQRKWRHSVGGCVTTMLHLAGTGIHPPGSVEQRMLEHIRAMDAIRREPAWSEPWASL